MPEIGATLREARMRARIDISEIETATKIRAKYLRALENEEWDLLPGPTFVKTFLRTYAEALGLDAKLLVEEYKLRHERLSDSELRPIAPRPASAGGRGGQRGAGPRGGGPRGGGGGGGGVPRGYLAAGLVLLLLALLAFIGRNSGDDDPATSVARTTSTATTTTPAPDPEPADPPASSGTAPTTPRPASRTVRLKVVPTGEVYVCLRNRAGETLIGGVNLQPGEADRTFRSSRFELVVGNSNVRLLINGKERTVPPSTDATGYVITRNGRRTLARADFPTCGA